MIPEVAMDVEAQSILALCHHSTLNPACQSCAFRTAAAIEHLTVRIRDCVESMDGTP